MFKRSFSSSKCTTALRLAMARIKTMKNMKEANYKKLKKEVSQLLESGQDRTARIRVEHVVREEKMIRAYELIQIYCELILSRMAMIESQKSCPMDMKEAITSVIYASPICRDIDELKLIRKHFTTKYGKEFITAAAELRPDCGVNRMLIEKLAANPPDIQTKIKVLSAIAEEHNIAWGPPNALEETDNVQASPFQDQKHDQPGYSPLNSKTFTSTDFDYSKMTSPRSHSESTNTSETGHDEMRQGQSFSGEKNRYSLPNINMEFKDATSAAQAAAEAAQLAARAARAAVRLSKESENSFIQEQNQSESELLLQGKTSSSMKGIIDENEMIYSHSRESSWSGSLKYRKSLGNERNSSFLQEKKVGKQSSRNSSHSSDDDHDEFENDRGVQVEQRHSYDLTGIAFDDSGSDDHNGERKSTTNFPLFSGENERNSAGKFVSISVNFPLDPNDSFPVTVDHSHESSSDSLETRRSPGFGFSANQRSPSIGKSGSKTRDLGKKEFYTETSPPRYYKNQKQDNKSNSRTQDCSSESDTDEFSQNLTSKIIRRKSSDKQSSISEGTHIDSKEDFPQKNNTGKGNFPRGISRRTRGAYSFYEKKSYSKDEIEISQEDKLKTSSSFPVKSTKTLKSSNSNITSTENSIERPNHVHKNLPDYDNLLAYMQSLRENNN